LVKAATARSVVSGADAAAQQAGAQPKMSAIAGMNLFIEISR
jgi:hypothetical protein